MQVLKPPRRSSYMSTTSHTHMGGRTVVGLFGIFSVKGINGRHIDQVDGKRARLELVALGEARKAIGVAANYLLPGHSC